MQITLTKKDEAWAMLQTELAILQAGTSDMYLQYLADLALRTIEPVAKSYQEKRIALVKKHGKADPNNPDSISVRQYVEVKEDTKKKAKKDAPTESVEPVETEEYKAFQKELEPIRNHETQLTVECIEVELFRKENVKDYSALFLQIGHSTGVYRFSMLFEITDKTASTPVPAEKK